jgi:hypothetical protein
MEISIHDNILYGYQVRFESSPDAYELILYTEYFQAGNPVEYTDVVFSNVLTHQFETVTAATVIFDIEETPAEQIFLQNEELFARLKNYGWPFLYADQQDLLSTLEKKGVRGFKVHSSCGLDGWIWAGNMKLLPRTERKLLI